MALRKGLRRRVSVRRAVVLVRVIRLCEMRGQICSTGRGLTTKGRVATTRRRRLQAYQVCRTAISRVGLRGEVAPCRPLYRFIERARQTREAEGSKRGGSGLNCRDKAIEVGNYRAA